MSLNPQPFSGCVGEHTAGPLLVYTDGSAARRTRRDGPHIYRETAWAYITSAGDYQCGVSVRRDENADPALIAELLAVHQAIATHLDQARIGLRIDSLLAIRFINRWKQGDTRLPTGYADNTGGRVPPIEVLRRRVARLAHRIVVEHVHGHAGDPLNEAAHALARAAMRWKGGRLSRALAERQAATIARNGILDELTRQGTPAPRDAPR